MVLLLLMAKVGLLGSLTNFISYLLSAMEEVRKCLLERNYANVCMISLYYWFIYTRIKLYQGGLIITDCLYGLLYYKYFLLVTRNASSKIPFSNHLHPYNLTSEGQSPPNIKSK
jgi:hypothetical protein